MRVVAREGEPSEDLVARFKRGMVKSGILKDLKTHRFFVGPGEQRRMKEKEAERKLIRRQRKADAWRLRRRFSARPS
jgi:ribosomal protein S21